MGLKMGTDHSVHESLSPALINDATEGTEQSVPIFNPILNPIFNQLYFRRTTLVPCVD